MNDIQANDTPGVVEEGFARIHYRMDESNQHLADIKHSLEDISDSLKTIAWAMSIIGSEIDKRGF